MELKKYKNYHSKKRIHSRFIYLGSNQTTPGRLSVGRFITRYKTSPPISDRRSACVLSYVHTYGRPDKVMLKGRFVPQIFDSHLQVSLEIQALALADAAVKDLPVLTR